MQLLGDFLAPSGLRCELGRVWGAIWSIIRAYLDAEMGQVEAKMVRARLANLASRWANLAPRWDPNLLKNHEKSIQKVMFFLFVFLMEIWIDFDKKSIKNR